MKISPRSFGLPKTVAPRFHVSSPQRKREFVALWSFPAQSTLYSPPSAACSHLEKVYLGRTDHYSLAQLAEKHFLLPPRQIDCYWIPQLFPLDMVERHHSPSGKVDRRRKVNEGQLNISSNTFGLKAQGPSLKPLSVRQQRVFLPSAHCGARTPVLPVVNHSNPRLDSHEIIKLLKET